ncbi:class I SAM-dependent methyltransferase [Streptomyces sp. NPDC047928]|uniref:class I SAM-dependent methyltransferase n=1 Tax=unclassified Streptomyces TaxID=2593676 RepID=UPI0037218A5A
MTPHQHTHTAGHGHTDHSGSTAHTGHTGSTAHTSHTGHTGHGDVDWGELLPLLERGAELQSPLYRQAAAWLGDLVPSAAVRRVLDVGSGPGVLSCLLAEAFPYAEVVAVDGTPELLERAGRRAASLGHIGARVTLRHAELPDALGELGDADLIWAGDAVHHLGDQGAALAALARLLRPGGVLALVEGGLPTRYLPRDIGIGRPGLEARLDAASADAFTEMREALPDFRAETEDWRAMFTAAGLEPSGTRSFLQDVPAPVPHAVREHAITLFTRQRARFADRIDGVDLATLDRLLDPSAPGSLHQRPDLHLLTARTVHTARRVG